MNCLQLKMAAGSRKTKNKEATASRKKASKRAANENEAKDGHENGEEKPSAYAQEAMGDLKESAQKIARKPHKKNVWMLTDPLDFPPSKYHGNLFACNQPFVSVSHCLPAYDKFGKLKMKKEVRSKAVEFLLRPCLAISRNHESRGEMGGRVLHEALFQKIWRITKPSARLMESLDIMEEDYELKVGPRKKPKYEIASVAEENEDFLTGEIEAPKQDEKAGPSVGEVDACGSSHSNESVPMDDEVMPDDGEETGKGRMDMRISVYNSSNLKWKEKFGRRDEVDPRKSVCVVECKWDTEDENAIYQAACYACQEALQNIRNLHLDPIYVLVLSKAKWTYGILDPRGKVSVLEGGIDIGKFSEFSEQEGIRFSDNPTSAEELKGRLRDSTTYYRDHFSSCPGAVYPQKQFVVGTLHIRKQWFSLPDFRVAAGGTGYGVHLFYEGLLRIIIGEKVTGWDMEDLKTAKRLKDAVWKEQAELFFASSAEKL